MRQSPPWLSRTCVWPRNGPTRRVKPTWFLTPTLQRYARADLKGTVYVHRAGDGAEICRLPGPGPKESWPGFESGMAVCWPCRIPARPRSGLRLPGTGTPELFLEQPWLGGFCFSPDGRQVAVQHPDHSIGIFDLATAKMVQHLASVGRDSPLVFNPTGGQLRTYLRTRPRSGTFPAAK